MNDYMLGDTVIFKKIAINFFRKVGCYEGTMIASGNGSNYIYSKDALEQSSGRIEISLIHSWHKDWFYKPYLVIDL